MGNADARCAYAEARCHSPIGASTPLGGLVTQRSCFVSLSGDNTIVVIDYASVRITKVVPVGRFPQRTRLAKLPERVIAVLGVAAAK